MRLKDQVALITGGGTGLGRATALQMAREGAAVAVNYNRSQEAAEAVVAQIRDAGGRAMAVQADVSEDPRVRDMVGRVLSEWGRVDVLVNNAATTQFIELADLEGLTEDVWDRILSVNVKGTFFCSRAVAPAMKRQKSGRIINIASIAGLTGRGSCMAYCASKAGIISLTQSLAVALAPDILVNAIAPGFMETRWTEGKEDFRAYSLERTLLQRVATPDDIAEVIVTFAADARYVTGQILRVDGGRTL
jgi:3-oxoacyl-[acyl-carrier protein] reductase